MRISDWSSDVCSSDLVDSILIDEARTPLIISGPAEDSSEMYKRVDVLLPKLGPDDYEKDEKGRTVAYTDAGLEKKIGRASCRERVCQYVEISVVAVELKQKTNKNQRIKRKV